MTVEGNIGSVRWTVESADSTLFYGLAMDGTSGIVLDNFSLRGSSGLSLRSVPVWMMREFNEQRPYDLIILQYGLNVATERGRNYDKYIAGMQTTVQHLKEAFPQAAILIVSVGDRDYKTEEGELRTMPGIKNLVRYNRIWRRMRLSLSGTCSRLWVGKAVWQTWCMPSRHWPIMIIRTSTSVVESILRDYFMSL